MTKPTDREKQIEEAAKNEFIESNIKFIQLEAFRTGAEFADKNPSREVQYGIGDTLFKQRDKIQRLEAMLDVAQVAMRNASLACKFNEKKFGVSQNLDKALAEIEKLRGEK